MTHRLTIALLAGIVLLPAWSNAQQRPAAASQRINACSLLTKDEVKKLVPWEKMFDQMPVEETPIGTAGSACNYPSADIQVMSFSPSTIDALRKQGPLEKLSGLGDEAYYRNNPDGYAEVFVRVGKRLVTVQANASGSVDAVKPGAIKLAAALAAKLP